VCDNAEKLYSRLYVTTIYCAQGIQINVEVVLFRTNDVVQLDESYKQKIVC